MKNKKLWIVVAILMMLAGALLIWQPWSKDAPASFGNEPAAVETAETVEAAETVTEDSTESTGDTEGTEDSVGTISPVEDEDAVEEAEGDVQGGL